MIPSWRPAGGGLAARVTSRVWPEVGILGLYLGLALAMFSGTWVHPATWAVGSGHDPEQIMWFLSWPPFAITHGLNPFVTDYVDYPAGVNLMWNTPMLLPGVLLAPGTLVFGPQVSLTLLLTAGFAGSATALFAVLRRWQVGVPGAALGAAVYGFSPALAHSAIGHYDLQFAVFPPLIVDAVLRLAAGRVSARRGGLQLGVLVTAQLFITEEILAATAIAGIVMAAVVAASRPRAVTGAVRRTAAGLGVAAAVPLVLAAFLPLRHTISATGPG